MNTIHLFVSEIDNSLRVLTDNELVAFENKQNKAIRVSPKLEIKPWSSVCAFSFPRKQTAQEFKLFLETEAGIAFAKRRLLFDPLAELKKLLAVLPKSCPVYVMGGLALDAHAGKLIRPHNDADLICWRKDVGVVKAALRKIGYKVRGNYSQDDAKILRILETDEDNPAIEVKIIDEMPDGNFKFYVNGPGKQIYPKRLLGPMRLSLEGVTVPAITLELISELTKLSTQTLARIKKDDPKFCKFLGSKIANNKSDRRLIKQLQAK